MTLGVVRDAHSGRGSGCERGRLLVAEATQPEGGRRCRVGWRGFQRGDFERRLSGTARSSGPS